MSGGQQKLRQSPAQAQGLTPAYRLGVAARLLTAIVAGYGLGVGFGGCLAIALARLGGLAPLPAGLAGMMASFAAAAGVVIWAFAARDLKRMALGLALPTVFVAVVWIAGKLS